ncbi:MAG: sodium:calcium antiporter [Promethearchaeota archaeon]
MILAFLAVLLLIGGIFLITFSSGLAVKHSSYLAKALGISPLIIGLTLVSIGTDLSEIFNSIISSSMGHADIDIGDSIGSCLVQLTLVFGLLPILCGGFDVKRREVVIMGICQILALIVVYSIIEKGHVTTINALFMVGSLALYFLITYTYTKETVQEKAAVIEIIEIQRSKSYHATIAFVAFGSVAVSAYIIVQSVIYISNLLSIDEFIISFFMLSIGTSLPELAVDVNALRRKESKLALGDIIGSCIVDSTLSIGIGQLFFPQDVTASLATPTILYTIFASLIAFVFIAFRQKIDRKAGILLISLYFMSFSLFFLI